MSPPASATKAAAIGLATGAVMLLATTLTVHSTVKSARERLARAAAPSKVAVAANAEDAYCTPRFKEVLERVLHSCGLAEGEARRGCKPADVAYRLDYADQAYFSRLFKGHFGMPPGAYARAHRLVLVGASSYKTETKHHP